MASSERKRPAYAPNRSCERCRALKIKCVPQDALTCQRCYRLSADCVYGLPAKRKPRKRTDVKVAELEKEVRALSSLLRKQKPSSSSASSSSYAKSSQSSVHDGDDCVKSTVPQATIAQQVPQSSPIIGSESSTESNASDIDVVDSGLVPHHLANEIFDLFRTGFLPRFPIIAFPSEVTADDVRSSRPILYLSIIAAASSRVEPSLGFVLNNKVARTIADLGMVQGVKSLDLLQGLLVTTAWHYPENSFDHLRYHSYAHLAAGMVSYLGIEGRSVGILKKAGIEPFQHTTSKEPQPSLSRSEQEEEYKLLDGQRSLLACYLLCSGISRSLHRPSILPFTSYMYKCIESLSTSRYAARTDKSLALWVQIQRVMTESAAALGLDDADIEIDLSEQRVQRLLNFYDSKLQSFYPGPNDPPLDSTLNYVFHTHRVALHEISLYMDHEKADFHPPLTIERMTKPVPRRQTISSAHVESLSICWSNSVQTLDLFLNSPVEYLRCSPAVIFVRMIYCATVLVKIMQSANYSQGPSLPFVDASRDQVIQLIGQLIPYAREVGRGGLSPIAERFACGLERIKAWCSQSNECMKGFNATEDLLEPLRDLSLQNHSEVSVSSKDVTIDELSSTTDSIPITLPMSSTLEEQVTEPLSEDGNANFLEDCDFMAWDDFEWNIPTEASFEFESDLLLDNSICLPQKPSSNVFEY